MMKPHFLRQGLAVAIVSMLFGMLAVDAVAGSPRDSYGNGKRETKSQEKGDAAEQKNKFPDATRKPPEGKASAALGKKLEKLFSLYDDSKNPETRAAADEIIANPKANAYEKSLADQVAAQAAYAMDDNAAAKAYLQSAIDTNGLDNNGHYQSMYMLAQLQMQDEQYAQAMDTLDRFLTETRAKDPEYLAVKGNILYRLERYPEAIAALQQAIASAGDAAKPDWQQMLMASYFESDQPAEAARIAEAMVAKNPSDKKMQLNLASIYMQADQNDKAIALLEKMRAAGQLTEDKDYRNLYALYLNTDGKEKQAIGVINDGVGKGILKPDYQTYLALGQAYYFSDQMGPAIENYQKAAPLAPDGETYLNLAKLLWGEDRIGEAKQAAQKALDKGVKVPADAKKILALKG